MALRRMRHAFLRSNDGKEIVVHALLHHGRRILVTLCALALVFSFRLFMRARNGPIGSTFAGPGSTQGLAELALQQKPRELIAASPSASLSEARAALAIAPRPPPQLKEGERASADSFYHGPLYTCRRLNRIRFDAPRIHFLDAAERPRGAKDGRRDMSASLDFGNWTLSHPQIEDKDWGDAQWWRRYYSAIFSNAHKPCSRDDDGFNFCQAKDSTGAVHVLDSDPQDDEDWVTINARATPLPSATPSPSVTPSPVPSVAPGQKPVFSGPHSVSFPHQHGPVVNSNSNSNGTAPGTPPHHVNTQGGNPVSTPSPPPSAAAAPPPPRSLRQPNQFRASHICGPEGNVLQLLVSKEAEDLESIFGGADEDKEQGGGGNDSEPAWEEAGRSLRRGSSQSRPQQQQQQQQRRQHQHQQQQYLEVDSVFWADTPASVFFQHWVQNNLPKLAQASLLAPDLLNQSPVLPPASSPITTTAAAAGSSSSSLVALPLTVSSPLPSSTPRPIVAVQELLEDRFPIVRSLNSHLGYGLTDYHGRVVPIKAKRLVYSCNAPPLHPWLWQKAHSDLLKIQSKPIQERDTIVFCGRDGAKGGRIENKARRLLNEEELLKSLEKEFSGSDQPQGAGAGSSDGTSKARRRRPLKIDYFNHQREDLKSIPALLEYFSRARAVVGPHGGCLTNVVFSSCNTVVLEIMPLWQFRPAGISGHGLMMMVQASFLEHDYRMLPLQALNRLGDVNVPVAKVVDILKAAIDAQEEW